MMKVIANLFRQIQSEEDTVMSVKLLFLNDLLKLFTDSRDNRRSVLALFFIIIVNDYTHTDNINAPLWGNSWSYAVRS